MPTPPPPPGEQRGFDRDTLVEALDQIGAAALAAGQRLDLAIYGGAALLLATNFRFSTEDVDIAELATPWPHWLAETVATIAETNGWSNDWLNDAVQFHLSAIADREADHLEFGSFPRGGSIGLTIIVPTAEYMLALKLKAMRTTDAIKGAAEMDDIFNLMRILSIDSVDAAMQLLARYFPNSARDTTKQRFLLRHLAPSAEARINDAPFYLGRSVPESPRR